jgi:hypothetical protein
MTIDEVLTLTAATHHVSRNALYPLRVPCQPDQMLPVYRTILVKPYGVQYAKPRRLTCGAINGCRTDVWLWSPSGHRVEHRIDLRQKVLAATVLSGYYFVRHDDDPITTV